jgi:hypothetical protein
MLYGSKIYKSFTDRNTDLNYAILGPMYIVINKKISVTASMNVYIYIVSIRKCHKNSADEITKNARQVLHGEAKEALTGNLSTGN